MLQFLQKYIVKTIKFYPKKSYGADCAKKQGVVSIDLFWVSCICPPKKISWAKSVSKVIAPPREMLLSFSIGTFLTNYDVTNRKHYLDLIYSIVRKRTIWEPNKSMETTQGGSTLHRSGIEYPFLNSKFERFCARYWRLKLVITGGV